MCIRDRPQPISFFFSFKLEGEKKDIGWGSQIRSYVFHPYNMIKDHRTKHEVGNIKSVMDGNIDDFIYSYLLDKMEKNK